MIYGGRFKMVVTCFVSLQQFLKSMPILICEEIKGLCEKKKKAKESKPEPVKFVCSECGEIFTSENKGKAVQGID